MKEPELVKIIGELKDAGIKNVVLSGVFSPINAEHENRVSWIIDMYSSYRWLSGRQKYLRYVSNGDTAVLHQAIDIVVIVCNLLSTRCYRWLSANEMYLERDSNGVTSLLHWTINISIWITYRLDMLELEPTIWTNHYHCIYISFYMYNKVNISVPWVESHRGTLTCW